MHQVVRSVASGDLLLTTPTQTVVLVGCLVASNKRAGKARLASEPPHRGDASPDAPLDASLHSTIQPFGAVWRLGAALRRRLTASLGLPSSASCASRWYHCRLVALPLPDWRLPWLGNLWCLSVVHGQVSVLSMPSLGTSATTALNSLLLLSHPVPLRLPCCLLPQTPLSPRHLTR